jgi:murein DD-endopeptidase MepM/ murein hydrolase activator NlpD
VQKNGYKIIFIKEGKFDLKQVNLTSFHIGLIITAIVAMTSSLFFIFSDQFVEWAGSREVEKHRSNNDRLVKIIEENQLRIDDMVKQLELIKEQDDLLRKLVKLPPIHKDVRKLGVGGKKNGDNSENLKYLLPLENIDLPQINQQLDMVNRFINLESLSFAELVEKAEHNADAIKKYPAIHPLNKNDTYKLSSKFGHRRDPFTHKFTFHDGHDFSARTGTPVYSTAEGRVKISKYYSTFGNYIEIDHGNGYVTIYGHLSNRKVKVGEKVVRGQKIGEVGNTGRSTAPHLHYEIQYRKRSKDPVDFYFDTSSLN